jgi:hypothetical protein
MAYIDNPYANSLRQAQAMPAVQQALGGYEGGMDGLMRLFQQQIQQLNSNPSAIIRVRTPDK